MNVQKKLCIFELLLFHRPIKESICSISKDMIFYTVENKYKLFIAVTAMMYSFMQVALYLYKVVINPDIDYIFNYAPMIFFCYFNLCCLMQVFIKYKYIKNSSGFIKQYFMSINSASEKAKLEIGVRVGVIKKLILLTTTVSFATAFPCLPLTGIDFKEDLFPFVEFLDHINIPSKLKMCMAITNYILAFPTFYFVTLYVSILGFYASNIMTQAILIKWNLTNLTNNFGLTDEDGILQDVQKQMMIENKLKKCIKQHKILCEFVHQMQGFLYYTAIWHMIGAVVLLASLSYSLAFRIHSRINNKIVLITELTVVVYSTYVYCLLAELAQRQMENILDATTETKWYYLSNKNRKIFLIFITSLGRKRKLSLGGILDANLDLCIYIIKKAYAVVSLLAAIN